MLVVNSKRDSSDLLTPPVVLGAPIPPVGVGTAVAVGTIVLVTITMPPPVFVLVYMLVGCAVEEVEVGSAVGRVLVLVGVTVVAVEVGIVDVLLVLVGTCVLEEDVVVGVGTEDEEWVREVEEEYDEVDVGVAVGTAVVGVPLLEF
jgi:hypothetical protein